MKIICELRGRSYNLVTTHECSGTFGMNTNNPFPSSHFLTGVVFDDRVELTYIVNPAPKEDSCPV